MMAGTMGTVALFIESKMPARLAEMLIVRVPDVKWAVCMLALFAGVISAFVDNVATVLMVAPVGFAIARKLKISPVPVLIAIAVSSNLQGAATLVGDTTSILLGSFADMNFFDFFWMRGRPGIFWGVELGALASLAVLLWLFRRETQPIAAKVETEVEDDVPTALMLLTVGLLIAASFLPEPAAGPLHTVYELRSGLVCMGLCLFGVARACLRAGSAKPLAHVLGELDCDTLLLLFGLFIVIAGIHAAGVIDAAARLFHAVAGESPFRLFTLLVVVSVVLSAFIDNIPLRGRHAAGGAKHRRPDERWRGRGTLCVLLRPAHRCNVGRQPDPHRCFGQYRSHWHSAQNGETVTTRDFLRIGVPFTLAAVLAGYAYLWLVWGKV